MAPLSWKTLALLAVAAFPVVSAIEVAFASSDANCWQYKGCYNETDSIHPLQFKILPSLTEDTNNENCQSACLAAGYLMSGTADAYNCWCDNTLNPKSNKLLESYCNVPCNTVTSEICGGYSAVSVYSDTCLSSPPAPSKTIIITVVPQPTPTQSIHTIYTTVIVTGPVNTQRTSTRTSVIYVQAPTATNPYSSSRQPPYRYSSTAPRAAQNTCTDILCCFLNSATCDYTQYINGNGEGISLVLVGTAAPKLRREIDDMEWHPTQTSAPSTSYATTTDSYTLGLETESYSTSTIYSTSTHTVYSCPPEVTSCSTGAEIVETISVSTTICPVTTSTTPIVYPTTYPTTTYPASTSSSAEVSYPPPPATSSSSALGLSLTTTTSTSTITNATVTKASPSPSQVVQGAAERLGASFGLALGLVGLLVVL